MNRYLLVLSAIIAVELVIISSLGSDIYKKTSGDLSASLIKVYPIPRDTVIFRNNSQLKYFYEINSKTNVVKPPEWYPHKTVYQINSDFLNDRFDYSVDKPKNTFRIVTLGDSWTFGWLIDTPDNYSEVLEEMLNNNMRCKNFEKFEVLNLGVGGYDVEYSIERFKLRGVKYNPDLVLMFLRSEDFIFANELFQPILTAEGKSLNRDFKGSQRLDDKSPLVFL